MILYIIIPIFLFTVFITWIFIYKTEKYVTLKNVGKHIISHKIQTNVNDDYDDDDDPEHKYDSHRYKIRQRYNVKGQYRDNNY